MLLNWKAKWTGSPEVTKPYRTKSDVKYVNNTIKKKKRVYGNRNLVHNLDLLITHVYFNALNFL